MSEDYRNKPVIVGSGIVESIRTRQGDKSILFTISTQEMKAESKVVLFDIQDKFINFFISENQLTNQDIVVNMPNPEKLPGKRTPSQRLREMLFKVHKKERGNEESFEEWYAIKINELINHYKNKYQL